MENPFAKKPAKQEVDTSWIDLAEGKLGAEDNCLDFFRAEIA